MAGTIRRRKQTVIPDNPAYDISADEWNDSLVVSGGTTGQVMLRDTTAADGWSLGSSVTVSGLISTPQVTSPVGSDLTLISAPLQKLQLEGSTNIQTLVGGAAVLNITAAGLFPGGAGPSVDNTLDLGASTNRFRSGYFGTSLNLGTSPATTGVVRLPNNVTISARNAANSADLDLIKADNFNQVLIGNNAAAAAFSLSGVTLGVANSPTPIWVWTVTNQGHFVPGGASSDLGLAANPVRHLFLSGVVKTGDGTSGAPSLAFASEPTLGFWRSGAGSVALQGAMSTTGQMNVGGAFTFGANLAKFTAPADGHLGFTNTSGTSGFRLKADALPTVASGFGTSPSVTAGSTPLAGSVNVGTGGASSSGVINFNGTAFPFVPFVVCLNLTTGLAVKATASTTQLTISTATGNFGVSDVISWICISAK